MESIERIGLTNKKIVRKRSFRTFLNFKKILPKLIFIILVVALSVVSYAYFKERNKKLTSQQIQEMQRKEVDILLQQLKKHIILPDDQKPTVATITDAEALKKDSPFFEKAQNGFKVIIYPDKAILFDVDRDVIVNVAPVQLGSRTQQKAVASPKPGTEEKEEKTKQEKEKSKSGESGAEKEVVEE